MSEGDAWGGEGRPVIIAHSIIIIIIIIIIAPIPTRADQK